MGNNTLETILGGIGRKEQVNQYKEALVGDILPRNANGEVEALVGSVGAESAPFSVVHSQETRIKKISLLQSYEIAGLSVSEKLYNTGSHTLSLLGGVYTFKLFGGGSNGFTGSAPADGYAGGGGGYCEVDVLIEEADSVSIAAGGIGGTSSLTVNGEILAAAYGGSGPSSGGYDIMVTRKKIIRGFGGYGGAGGRSGGGETVFFTVGGGAQGGGGGGGGNGGAGSMPFLFIGGGGGGYYSASGQTGGAGAIIVGTLCNSMGLE